MNKKLLLALAFLCTSPAFAQFPGGNGDSLKVWLKANSGIALPTATVALWNNSAPSTLTGNFVTNGVITVAQLPPTYDAAGINFNPQIVFNRNTPNSLSSANLFSGNNLFDPTNNTILQVMRLHTFSGTGVFLKWQFSNTSARLGFEVNNNGTSDGRLRFDFNGSLVGATNYNDQYIIADYYTSSTQKAINVNGAVHITGAAATNATTCIGKLAIGNEPVIGTNNGCTPGASVDPYPTTYDVAEIIIFRRLLSAAERNKVESYLAVKYGFTLDQGATAANNYTSSTGTVIWNRTANTPYLNNITGIGRDDGDSLIQRQSRSINVGTGLVTLYNGTYNGATAPLTNVANTNNFTANNSYLLVGDNALGLTQNKCVSVGSTSFLKIDRVWKAQITGTIGTVTVAMNAADLPNTIKHLLVSSDSTFTPANTVAYRLDNVNSVLSKSITLPGANSYFTYASDSLILHPTSNSPLCEGGTLQLNANLPGLTSYSWTGPGFTSLLANPTIVGVGLGNAGTYTLNASSGTCVLPAVSLNVTVARKPAPPTVTTPLIYCQYINAPPLSALGTDLKWYIQPVGGVGIPTPPIPNTMYEDTLVYWVTQSNQGCESIRTKQVIQIRYKPNGIILGTQESICQGAIDTFNYFGNARPATAQYDFKSPAFVSTVLSGSGEGPYIVRFDSAGTYRVRMQVNNDGCVSDEMFYTVTVRPSPVIRMSAKEDVCVDEVVTIALYYTTNNVTRYTYDFGTGKMVFGTATGGPYGISWDSPGDKIITLNANTTGCPARTTTNIIHVHPNPDARIRTVSSTNICTGDSVLFTASEQDSNTRFTWTPDNFFNSGNIYKAWGIVKKDGFVRLDVESRWGCKAADSVKINAKPCCELFLPNVFTPNNDGKNDVFHVVTQGHHDITNFRIMNRWGQVVFETKDELHGWDGTYNGRDQDVGTYYYYVKYQCSSREYFEQKGELLLLR